MSRPQMWCLAGLAYPQRSLEDGISEAKLLRQLGHIELRVNVLGTMMIEIRSQISGDPDRSRILRHRQLGG